MQRTLKKQKEGWKDRSVRLTDTRNLSKKSLHQFLNGTSLAALRLLKLDIDFLLESSPKTWPESEDYAAMNETIKAIAVTNDSAERAMALITEFNDSSTRDEENKQFLLQNIEENRRKFPDAKKKTLVSGLSK
jgi:hypothetical protein